MISSVAVETGRKGKIEPGDEPQGCLYLGGDEVSGSTFSA